MFLCSAIEHFVKKKNIVNIKKDDGYMPLHLAALNGHLDVVTTLAEMVIIKCIQFNPVSQYCSNVLWQAFTFFLWFSFLTWLCFNFDRSKYFVNFRISVTSMELPTWARLPFTLQSTRAMLGLWRDWLALESTSTYKTVMATQHSTSLFLETLLNHYRLKHLRSKR